MTKKKATNGRDLMQAAPAPKGESRLRLESHLRNNPGCHTVGELAQALSVTPASLRGTIATAVTYGEAVNVNPGIIPARYQHKEHWQRENRVNRRAPITASAMENGSTEWWAAHMARFNANPRDR
jgi:hypothetical protein